MNTSPGWNVRKMAEVGKTEILCADAAALRLLKVSAAGIPASEIYPSFLPEFPYTLFFFDVREEFLEWLNQYVASAPAPRAAAAPGSRATRTFGAMEAAVSMALLVVVSAVIFSSAPRPPHLDVLAEQSLVASPPPVQARLDETRLSETETPAARSIAGAETGAISVLTDSAAVVPAPPAGTLKVWFVDVGLGDGIIIKLPNGSFVVIDSNRGSDDEMANLLAALGCSEIMAMVMTHPHADHLGGMEGLMARFKVKTFYDPGVPHPTAGYRKLLLAVEEHGIGYEVPKSGDKLLWDKDVTVTVLNAGPGSGEGINNASIVLKVQYGRTAMIFTGDAEEEAERHVLSRFRGQIRADLLKVGHHGSRSSSIPDFLREVAARFAVISCGIGNTYGHPAPQTLKSLAAAGAQVYRTDEEGTILAESDGQKVTVQPLSAVRGR